MIRKTICGTIFAVVLCVCYSLPGFCGTPVTAKLKPNEISIGAFFNGTQLSVSGTVPSGSQVLVMLTGKQEDLILKKKGRALGVLWMNVASVSIEHVPVVYLMNAPQAILDFAAAHPDPWRALDLGFEHLQKQAEILPATEDKNLIFNEFLKLKKGAGLYGFNQTPMHYDALPDGLKTFETEIFIPPKVPLGEYEIKAVAIEQGAIVGSAQQSIFIKAEGMPAFLANLSFNHGAVYGLLAVLMAVAAGLLMDFLFGESKGAH